jgi:molybdenum cofactor biosynthesis enzyme MoaA
MRRGPLGCDPTPTVGPQDVAATTSISVGIEGTSMVDRPTPGPKVDVTIAEPDMWRLLHDREQISRKLRVSITDSCNLRCFFCHNEGQGAFGRVKISQFTVADYQRIVKAAVNSGIREVKLTGGEPLLYRNSGQNIVDLISGINFLRGKQQFGLSMITNGLLLPRYANELKAAGLDRVTISLHTLDEAKHRLLISPSKDRRSSPEDITQAIRVAVNAGLTPVKVNTVLFHGERGSNVPELAALIRECEQLGVSQLRLYTLLRHERFPDHSAWYRFWDKELLTQLGVALYSYPQAASDFAAKASEVLNIRKYVLYPKPTLVMTTGKLEVAIEDMETGRFEPHGLPDEGPYALRLSASGQLRGVLSQDSPSFDLQAVLRREDASAELEAAFVTARKELLP